MSLHVELIFALAYISVQISAFSLYDEHLSYAEFEKWPMGNSSRLSFRFKTHADNGLILYADDGGFRQFLTLYLDDGRLVLDIFVGGENRKQKSRKSLNNVVWHGVIIQLNSRHVVISIDGDTLADFKTKHLLRFQSMVYFGGFPRSMSIADVAAFDVTFRPRLLGCIEDVRYGGREAIMINSAGTGSQCGDMCRPKNPCINNGVCLNKFAIAKCVCTGTGFMGERCETDLPVIGIPRNDSRVVIVLPSVVVANLEATSLLIRFRTSQSDGVFFYTAAEGDYITLELTNGEVAATVNLGSGNVTIVTKDHVCNDKQWHTVRLERFERMVNLTVDNGTIFTGYTKGDFTGFTSESSDQKTTIHLGGTGDIHLKTKSVSRRNFTGCLQELVFNQYDVFSKLGTDRVRSAGTIVTTCPETPTPHTATTTTTKPTTTTALTSEYTSPSNYVVTTVKSTLKSLRATTLASNTMPTTDPFPETTPTTDQVSTPYSVGNTKMDRNRFSRVGKVVITLPQKPSNGVIMEERHGPKEGDLTLWFILAAGVGIIAFVIVLIVMVKIHTASRRKYKIKQNKTALLNPNSGSFHRST